MSPAWSWQNYIPIFLLLESVIMVILLASFVGSWFGITFQVGFGLTVRKRFPYVDLSGMVINSFVAKVP